MNVIEINNLSKSFLGNMVFDNISFRVKKGSFTALLGKNGSGKSTILNILMGHVKLDSGECYLFGEDIKKDIYQLKNKIGHVSEKIFFNYPLTIEQFIMSYGRLYDDFNFEKFKKLASEVNIDLHKQFGEYSRGQKMQIVLMAALAHNPELLLIDEVTSVLDAYTRKFFISLLKDFTTEGGTVVLTTNIVNEVQFYCTDVILLSQNKIKFQSSLAEIPGSFKKIRREANVEHPLFSNPECIWSGINSDGSQSYIVPSALHDASDLTSLLKDRRLVTLEDLYIYYTQSRKDEEAS